MLLTPSKPVAGLLVFCCLLLVTVFSTVGCSGKSGMTSPTVYGSKPTDTDKNKGKEKSPPRDDKDGPLSYRYGKATDTQDEGQEGDTSGNDQAQAGEAARDALSAHKKISDQSRYKANSEYSLQVYSEDSAAAVDDDIWRLFDLAEEYYQMGVIANREASWEEAQYYLEKCLRIMATLDVESDSILTPEAVKYNTLLDNVVADYRVTMRSLGSLEDDVPPSVLVERFGDVERGLDDSIKVFDGENAAPVTYDLPVVMNERVKKSIVYFQTVAKDAFTKYLSRSKRYHWLFDDVLTQHGLPKDLVYLSLVESGYNPHAYSWARAMGLWQFIASTGRLYGLDRSWWVDERKDPVKSSHAAAKFLKDLYDKFGDWELAMAAYNGGPGRVSRTIAKQKTDDFWQLRLKRQTMDYVPLIYAATIIAKDPEKYGFTDIEFEDEIRWDEITIDRCLDLKVVAREIGCTFEEIKDLNPELLRQYTPPNTTKYQLKIPVGSKDKFLAAYDGMPSPKETSWVKHTIRRRETVSTIASKYGVSQYAVLAANNLSNRSRIYAGKQLIVPVPLDREYAKAAPKANDSYESENSIYAVRSGDTMWDIARAFGTTVDALRRVNYIERGSRIYVGQKLRIPSSANRLNPQPSNTGNGTYADAPKSQPGSNGGKKTYKVRKGDTLWDIARSQGTTTSAIRSLNGLGRSSRIYPGQVLVVNGDDSSAGYVTYTVRRGDTMSRIARQFRTSVTRIAAANGLTDPDNLRVGSVLRIYTK